MNPQEKEIVALLTDLLQKGHQLRKGTSVSGAGPGADVVVRLANNSQRTYRAKAANKIEPGIEVFIVFSPSDKILIAMNPYPPIPGEPIRIEQKENRRPPKPTEKKESAIVPILVSKTIGEALEERPECTCTHYAIGKVFGSRPFAYETCDGTVPGAGKDLAEVEQGGGISKVYYWCFNAQSVNSSTPWISGGLPACEEPDIPRSPFIDIYGARAQSFKENPFQWDYAPRTPLYSASNMYLVQIEPVAARFDDPPHYVFDPMTTEIYLSPGLQDLMWGFHLVADEQPILTTTGRKFSIKPTTISRIPTLTPPITAIANAQAWYHYNSSGFGGIVRLISNEEFNTDGWFVAFGDPVDCWYDDNDNPVADGYGTKREIGVTLRSFGYWNRVPWQLAVDPDSCPTNPTLEESLNEAPRDPEDPNKYLMTKWFVGGVTEQWLELPITHRVDDPHYAMISCNSEKKKIWVSIKTGLDPLNTYEEKSEWFADKESIFNTSTTHAEFPSPGELNNRIGLGKTETVKNNYINPSDIISNEVIFSNKRVQFSNQGARFCKIKILEIDIADSGALNLVTNKEYTYENRNSIEDNAENWNHLEMTTFLAYLGSNYMITPENIVDYRRPGRFGQDASSFFFSGHYTNEDLNIGEGLITDTFPEKNNIFISALTSFFGVFYHSYSPPIQQKQLSIDLWNNYKQSIFGLQPKQKINCHGVFAGTGSIILFNTEYNTTDFLLENPILFGPTHVMGVGWKDNLVNEFFSDSEYIGGAKEFRERVFYRKPIGIINSFKTFGNRSISYTRSIAILSERHCYYWPFWDKEDLDELLVGEQILNASDILAKEVKAKIKAERFLQKQKTIKEEPSDIDFYNKAIFFANLDKEKLCCFDFYRGYGFNGKPEQGYPPSLFNELAFSPNPVECPVYVCEFDENDDLKDYNIYAGKVANALVYPFDYTEGEPCSFTVWGAAPALMKLSKKN